MIAGDLSALQTLIMTPQPALDPTALARLERLTRDYARLSTDQAGLAGVLGGCLLLLAGGISAAAHGWRLSWAGAFTSTSVGTGLVLAGLPCLWLGARAGLGRWVTARFGIVAPLRPSEPLTRKDRMRAVVGRFVFPVLMLAGAGLAATFRLPGLGLRLPVVVTLALGLHVLFPRLSGKLERMTAILLCLAPTLALSGIQMAAGDSLLAYPLIGCVSLGLGLRDHLAFRRVGRELEGGRS